MRLFAILAFINEDQITDEGKNIVEAYLRRFLNKDLTKKYLAIFTDYLNEIYGKYDTLDEKKKKKRSSSYSVKILSICRQINEQLHQKEKLIVLIRIIEFANHNKDINEGEYDVIQTLSETFLFPTEEFKQLYNFICNEDPEADEQESYLQISSEEGKSEMHLHAPGLSGNIHVYRNLSTESLLLKYTGTDNIYLSSAPIDPGRIYLMESGSIIRGSKITPLYFSEIMGRFLQSEGHKKISLEAQDLEFRFPNSNNGIHDFDFRDETGNLIGIMGGSGVGKSTLLSLLNGTLKPQSGKILINGQEFDNSDEDMKSMIGFIPQDDLLIEELTVFQNLYFNAQLCFKDLSNEEIAKKTNDVLQNLGLFEIKNLRVGSPLNKTISGGQRKRLNIALELIREPSILFVDEPTSGLSSNDSEHVMLLLKELVLKGKLIIVNIHQPSSDIFKLFDRLLILDKGGYTVYNGNPIEALPYIKGIAQHVNAEESECPVCGNVNPEQILEIIESRLVDESGNFLSERRISPKEWHQHYVDNIRKKHADQIKDQEEPEHDSFKKPGRLKQFTVYFRRNLLSKLSNKQYMWLTLLEAPVLALIIAIFTRQSPGDEYQFIANENFPAFLFMLIIVPLFLGMTVSAEEIIKDRKILQREQFLTLSRFSYLLSKITMLAIISAIQTVTLVIIANSILEIHDMFLPFWFTLFTVSFFSNMMGLNISSGLDSVVSIYIIIPLILVPQLMLSGVIIKYENLNKNLTHDEYVPIAGDIMASRWAYEAMAVYQYKNNAYFAPVFDYEQTRSNNGYYSAFVIPEMKKSIDAANKNDNISEQNAVLRHAIEEICSLPDIPEFDGTRIPEEKVMDKATQNELLKWLDQAGSIFSERYKKATAQRDSIFITMEKEMGTEDMLAMKNENFNDALSNLMLNRASSRKIVRSNNQIIRKKDPIYQIPDCNYGRAHFLAPVKQIGNLTIDTFWFNNMVIWVMSIILMITLYFDMLRKLLNFNPGKYFRKKK